MLEILSALNSPCGGEEHIKKYIKTKLSGACEDSVGNLIYRNKGGDKKLVIYCSLDEDAIVVMSQKDGKINFAHVGDKKIHPGDTVSFGGYKGVVCSDNKEKPTEDMYIRTVGNVEIETASIGNLEGEYYCEENVVFMKEAAARVAVCSMIECADCESDFDTYFVFGVMGKKSSRGLVAALREIKPDKVLLFEQTEKENLTVKFLATGYVCSRELVEEITEIEPSVEKEVDSKAKSAVSFAECENAVCVGVPVKFANNIRQEINLDIKDKILNIIRKTMKKGCE